MLNGFRGVYHSLISRLISLVGLVLFVSIFTWAYFNINYQKKITIENIVEGVDRLGNTIKLGTHYAMMLNSREDINEIIKNIGRQEGIENIRVFNKQGQIKFSNVPSEVEQTTSIKADACYICHKREPPMEVVDTAERTRTFHSPAGYRLLGIISPIYNEPACSTDPCHVHPQGKRVLGALDVVVSLADTDRGIRAYEKRITALAVISFTATSAIIGVFLLVFVNRPIKRLITWTRLIGEGQYGRLPGRDWDDEIGQLASAIGKMGRQICEKQEELNRQRHEFQELFEQVPCYITVQDRDLRLLNYNRQFSRHFSPEPLGRCYEVYKGRTEKCEPCPVMRTFEDGECHSSEETGVTRGGVLSCWMVRTSPIRDTSGNITAVMETSLDITQMKRLEEEIRKSEQKYRDIFNHIPNAVFVLERSNLAILDSNDSMQGIYGYEKREIVGTPFMDLFDPVDRARCETEIRTSDTLAQTRQIRKDGKTIYVNICVSPSEYLEREAYLVTAVDVTERLMAEQQLIQASKMSTLGEMATGMAHELNQPLSVIKTASGFLVRKVKKQEPILTDILQTMAEEIDSHVDRASRIINHLREFGRKSEVKKERVDANEALTQALDIFSQQLKLRGIEVVRELEENLPLVWGDLNRMEQVFINLLINARDAIEEKIEKSSDGCVEMKILLRTSSGEGKVTVEVRDTGTGIPESAMDKIFEPFFTTKQVGKGTGLGLSISYGIVQDYQGTIRVETRENEGAAFIVEFPVCGEGS